MRMNPPAPELAARCFILRQIQAKPEVRPHPGPLPQERGNGIQREKKPDALGWNDVAPSSARRTRGGSASVPAGFPSMNHVAADVSRRIL
jgi:hypothetical protein